MFLPFLIRCFLSFQLPTFMNQFQGLPQNPPAAAMAVPGPSSRPSIPIIASGMPSVAPIQSFSNVAAPPSIAVVNDSDSDPDVQSITIPFRSSTSENFLPMVSTDDTWIAELEFRYFDYFKYSYF